MLLVNQSASKQLRAHLDDNTELPNVVIALGAEPDLDVSRSSGTAPRFLRAVDRFRHEVGQMIGQASQLGVGETAIVGDFNEWHDAILAARDVPDCAVWEPVIGVRMCEPAPTGARQARPR